ncbi:MAG: TIGR03087 family PEP-CTERM/XrtA system glycosyltransferase [Gammaproteobacteria bacterium]
MRILFLTHRIPYPPNKGDKIRSYHILNYLIKSHEIYLASLIDQKKDKQFLLFLKEHTKKFIHDTINPSIKKIYCLSSLLTNQPITSCFFYSKSLQRAIDKLIVNNEIDIFFCFSSQMAEYIFRSKYLDRIKEHICIIDMIDVDSCKWAQYAENKVGWRRWIYNYEARQLTNYEQKIIEFFDHVLVVSDQEKDLLIQKAQAANVLSIKNGVDSIFFDPDFRSKLRSRNPRIVFTGVMDYWPNIEGVQWFGEKIFPCIQKVIPSVEFFIVGSQPSSEIRRLGERNGIYVTGYVDDVRDYLSAADVCVAPLRIARGIQNKVLEAMSMAKAVVATPQALEGIQAEPGIEVLSAADEHSFATAVIELIQNKSKAQEMGELARECVQRDYNWEKNLSLLDSLILENTLVHNT